MSVDIRPSTNNTFDVYRLGAHEGVRGYVYNSQIGWFGKNRDGHYLYRPIGPEQSLFDDEIEVILNFMHEHKLQESTQCQ